MEEGQLGNLKYIQDEMKVNVGKAAAEAMGSCNGSSLPI